ncbi:MAG TPA: hypothetical protein VD907_03770 [Verrucomicrobiae bacterium]|nr:hypothetical protein [Verrucomicrobiae bacterium]
MDHQVATEVIVRAAQRLIRGVNHRTPSSQSGQFLVKQMVETSDIRTGSQGIYFGRTITCNGDGDVVSYTHLAILDHGDPASYLDHVPTTKSSLKLGHHDGEVVDLQALAALPDDQILRMASNILRVMPGSDQA